MLQAFKSKNFGLKGETLVADWLRKKGFKIEERNYRKKFGEIDLIASKKNIIAFVEVKSRNKCYFNLSEVINITKQKKIISAAKEYIATHDLIDKVCRFDVAFVQNKNENLEIEYIENAFVESNDL